MPKWSQNPSKIDEKSIQKSRSEKGRPKIEKNRGRGAQRSKNDARGSSGKEKTGRAEVVEGGRGRQIYDLLDIISSSQQGQMLL